MRRGLLPSRVLGIAVLAAAVLVECFVEPTYGSGIIRPSPLRVGLTGCLWLLAALYPWQRLREDPLWPSFGLVLMGLGATAGAVLLPIQLILWRDDVGHPQSRWRLELMWPLAWTLLAISIAAAGRVYARQRAASGRKRAGKETLSG
ncbi:MAG TPA: hypothetical protein VF669_15975 [Tepidisphaeraceae bacterium]|jgi:hypothetical protein